MAMTGVPILPADGLVHGRVRLRGVALTDAGLLQELARDPDVVRWTTYPANLDEGQARERIAAFNAAADRGLFCVAELDGRPAGTCGAGVGATEGAIEVYYAVLPWARRQGVAASALLLLTSAAQAAGAETVSLETHIDNAASQAVARHAGFVKVGHTRRVVKGVDSDLALWRWEPAREARWSGLRAVD